MALDTDTIKKLIKTIAVEKEVHDTFTKAYDSLNETLTAQLVSPTGPSSANPQPQHSKALERLRKGPTSIDGEDSNRNVDVHLYSEQALAPEAFTEEDFYGHVRTYNWDDPARLMLGRLLGDEMSRRCALLFGKEDHFEQNGPKHSYSKVYDVGMKGAVLPYAQQCDIEEQAIWQTLKATNTGPTKLRPTVGRIVILHEPSPALLAAAHLTLTPHLDMDSVLHSLSSSSPSRSVMDGCFQADPRHQKSFYFTLKYHMLLGHGLSPMDWQDVDKEADSPTKDARIVKGSSVVALSLSGEPIATVKNRSRKPWPDGATDLGQVFDPYSPWRVLSIHYLPNWKTHVDCHSEEKRYVNGPAAFLMTLLAAYREAVGRVSELTERVVALVKIPSEIIFLQSERDNLLFESDEFSNIRRYFWASRLLTVVDDDIRDMIAVYHNTFTDKVWAGKHDYIWSSSNNNNGSSPPRYASWTKHLAELQTMFEEEIQNLQRVRSDIDDAQRSITRLRDNLYVGTSILQSRTALHKYYSDIRKDRYLQLLAIVTLIFLPMVFVACLFGMRIMPAATGSFKDYAITAAAVCSTTYFVGLVGLVESLREKVGRLWVRLVADGRNRLKDAFWRRRGIPRVQQRPTRPETPSEGFELPNWERREREAAV